MNEPYVDALATLAVAGTAFAQSSVTISGTFGAGYQSYESGAKAATAAKTDGLNGSVSALGTKAVDAATNKGLTMTDASVKFGVAEDLGGGLKAMADVQITANNSRGGNATKEDSNVGLSGGFGSLVISNTRTSNTAIASQVFASSMPVTSFYAGVDARAAADVVTYTTPELAPGLKLGLQYVEATEGAVTSAAKANVLNVSYAAGPLAAVVAFKSYNTEAKAAAETAYGGEGKNRTEAAVTYDLGMAKVGLGYGSKRSADDKNLTAFGLNVPMGAITIGTNYAKRGDSKFYEAGAKYALSKRTTVNLMVGKLTGGSYEGKQSRVGIVHTF